MRYGTNKTMRAGLVQRGALVAMVAALGACQGIEKAEKPPEEDGKYTDRLQIADLGNYLRTVPDEFSVLTKRPLEMPQSFAALPTPEPGKISTRDPNPQADARAALAFDPIPASTGAPAPSASETAILSAAGSVDPSIRATLAAEQAQYDAEQNIYLLDRVFPRLREVRGAVDPEAIDAEAERLRLLDEGITPQRTSSIAPVPGAAVLPPPVSAPAIPAAPVATATIPAPVAPQASGVPTFGVLVPEVEATTPPLIYLPE